MGEPPKYKVRLQRAREKISDNRYMSSVGYCRRPKVHFSKNVLRRWRITYASLSSSILPPSLLVVWTSIYQSFTCFGWTISRSVSDLVRLLGLTRRTARRERRIMREETGHVSSRGTVPYIIQKRRREGKESQRYVTELPEMVGWAHARRNDGDAPLQFWTT